MGCMNEEMKARVRAAGREETERSQVCGRKRASEQE